MASNHFHEMVNPHHLALENSATETVVPASPALLAKWPSNLNSDLARWHNKRVAIKDRKHFCGSCKKAFKSKHALWGHMRIHSEDNKNNPNAEIKGEKFWRKTTCFVCGNNFQSTNALAGHTNSHPKRGWKGIRPPPWIKMPEIQEASSGEANESATPGVFCFDLNKLPSIEEEMSA